MTTQTKRKSHIEADPGALPTLVSSREAKKVRARLREKYGDQISDELAADLIAFTDAAKAALAAALPPDTEDSHVGA